MVEWEGVRNRRAGREGVSSEEWKGWKGRSKVHRAGVGRIKKYMLEGEGQRAKSGEGARGRRRSKEQG